MSTPTVFTTQALSALFKEVYPSMVTQLIPERELLLSTIPFMATEGGGNSGTYTVPFIYNRIHGVTFHGQNDANMYLNPSTASRAIQAQVRSSSMTMRAAASLTALSRAIQGGGSFVDATSYIIENLMESFSAVCEQVNFYGSTGLGQSASIAGEIGANVPGYNFDANGVDASLKAIRISFAEWAPAIWVGAEGMPIDVYTAAGVLIAKTEILQVDILNRILIVADASLLAAAVAPNVGFKIWRKGSKGYEAEGVHAILTNTTNLFGITAGITSLWYANVYPTAGTLDFATLSAGVSRAYARGLENSLQVHINSSQFAKMMGNFLTTKVIAGGATLTTLTQESNVGGCCRIDDEGNLVYGIRTMKFLINSITVEVVVNDYVKGGYAYGLDLSSWKRVGSSDLRFATEGLSEGNYFFQMPDAAAVEIRVFSDQALFTDRPARNILFTGLTEV